MYDYLQKDLLACLRKKYCPPIIEFPPNFLFDELESLVSRSTHKRRETKIRVNLMSLRKPRKREFFVFY
jgi:hypothetical protein